MTYLEIKRELLEKAKALIEQNVQRYICIAFVQSSREMRRNHSLGSVYRAMTYEAWMHCDREVHEILQGQDVEDYLLAKKLGIDPKQFRLELLSKMIDELRNENEI